MATKLLWALTRLSEIDARMADAGIYQDPDTGTVRIYGVVAEAERISEAEIRLSAAESRISLTATEAYVNQQVSIALTDPSQFPVFEGLQVRVNQVEADLDAAEAAIALKATQTEVDGMDARLSSAEVDIDAAQEAITLKVDQADFDAAESRLSTAEVQISTLDGPAITQSVSDVRNLHDQMALQDVATLEQLLLAYEQREALKTQIAYATQDIRARVDDDRSATAAITASLGVAIENSVALIESEKLVRASGDTALASSIDALEVRLDGDIAAQASASSALTTRVSTAEGAITSHSQSLISLEARLDVAEGGISGQATAQSQLDARVTSAEGVITSHGQSLISLGSRLDDAEGNAAGQATAPQPVGHPCDWCRRECVQPGHGDHAIAIRCWRQQHQHSADHADCGWRDGEYTLRINNNGHVTGMVVRSDLDDEGEPASRLRFRQTSLQLSRRMARRSAVPLWSILKTRSLAAFWCLRASTCARRPSAKAQSEMPKLREA
ncbi:gp58-like family protein [Leisingera sp. M658]|uniref:gp58-like family protein n=1 Tax=Leisingera sp. M658 TaxID=2867015 RepID=UPI0021A8185C|nr:gp58-like family protein [Leisingera sp. M658]UWQ77393.1 gp58-like family protein [Leisingera sp. M658]